MARPYQGATAPRGRPPEQIKPFEPGVSVDSIKDIPIGCQGTWNMVDGKWCLKFASAACPCQYCRRFYKQ